MEPVLDKCPGYNLYIGGFINLRRPKALKNCNISHIVSVLDWRFDQDDPLIRGYQHLHIPVDDVEDENLLEWFPRSNAFIQKGLEYHSAQRTGSQESQENAEKQEGGVFIHCAMGKSRSATVLLAYLLWSSRHRSKPPVIVSKHDSDMVSLPPKPMSVIEALQLLRQGRPIAEPNEGFMDQLYLYESMNCPTTDEELKSHKLYRRWMNKRSVEESLRVNQAPDMDHILFEDEQSDPELDSRAEQLNIAQKGPRNHSNALGEVSSGIAAPDGSQQDKHSEGHNHVSSAPQVTLKCRKCRSVLATTPFILKHTPPPHRDPNDNKQDPQQQTPLPPSQCAHVFLHPLSWMREALSDGQMEGRLTCPNKRCGVNVGKFAWTGLRCSCGGWETPGFGLIRGKVDEVVVTQSPKPLNNTSNNVTSRLLPGGATLRVPPGMRKGNL